MCCIFTCCGWMIDLIQRYFRQPQGGLTRVWVFVMTCCISSAVCCVLITSSMSGVALGYNYSLAEYIDTKETNVSVYIKRGVFDDDVVGDMMKDFPSRRGAQSEQQPLRRNADSENSKAGSDEVIDPDKIPVESARRLDDSIVETNSFEGSLMKLTLKPLHTTTKETTGTDDSGFFPDVTQHTPRMYRRPTPQPDALQQLKTIQGIINARKAGANRNPTDQDSRKYDDVNPYLPGPPPENIPEYRREMPKSDPGYQFHLLRPQDPELRTDSRRSQEHLNINPARFAVPSSLNEDSWVAPLLKPETFRKIYDKDHMMDDPTMPQPVTFSTGPIRPTSTKPPEYITSKASTFAPEPVARTEQSTSQRSIDSDDQGGMEDKFSSGERFDEKSDSEPDIRSKSFLEKLPGPKIVGQENNEYYDEELKGLPVRKRRNINSSKSKLLQKAKVIPQKVNQDYATKFKVSNSISNEIADLPSILVSKLHFLDNPLPNEATLANEKEVKNGTKTVGVTVNDTHSIIDASLDKALKVIQSMFS